MTRTRTSVNNIAAVSIIYCKDDPSRIFLETKTLDYPVKAFAGALCLIGGNWIGEAAKADVNPLATLRREINEELCLQPLTEAQHEELSLLGFTAGKTRDLQKDTKASEEDIRALAAVKTKICAATTHFVDATMMTPKAVFEAFDPESKCGNFKGILSYYTIPLDGETWSELERLQEKYGNLSNESISVILTFKEIRERKLRVSWGHDRALDLFCRFFAKDCEGIPLVEGIDWQIKNGPFGTYAEYLEWYDVAKRP